MDPLRRSLAQIRELYRRMTISQRWSTGMALLAILVSLLLLVLWTGRREFVPLLLGAPPEVTYRVMQNLQTKSIPYEFSNNILSVPYDVKDRLEIDLVGEGIFPEGQDVFSWVYDPDITETKGKRELKYLRSLTRRLQIMIESQAAVKSARVEITPAPQSVFLTQPEASKAAVTLQLQPGQKLKKETALAIARTVAAADRSLHPEDVTIVDTDGKLYRIPSDRDLASITSDQLEVKSSWEESYKEKAMEQLIWLNKKVVTVDVTLDFDSKHQKSHVLDPEKTVLVEERERIRDSKGPPTGGTPGAESNVLGISQTPFSTAVGEKFAPSTDTQNETENRSETSFTETETTHPPGEAKEVNISVIVDSEELSQRQGTIEKIQQALAGCIPGHDVKKVSVIPVSFAPPPAIPAPTTAENFEEYRKRYGDQAVLLVVILGALIMVSWIVRRAVPRDVMDEFERARAGLRDEEGRAGEEPPEPTSHLTKVREMVQENPRTAASLLKRWVMEEKK